MIMTDEELVIERFCKNFCFNDCVILKEYFHFSLCNKKNETLKENNSK